MKVLEAKNCFFDYHRINSKRNTIRNYDLLILKFCDQFGHRDLEYITSEEVLAFLTRFTEGTKQSTKRLRYSLLSAFFNFIQNLTDPQLQNPCDTPILKKLFKNYFILLNLSFDSRPYNFTFQIGNLDITDFDGLYFFQVSWRYL